MATGLLERTTIPTELDVVRTAPIDRPELRQSLKRLERAIYKSFDERREFPDFTQADEEAVMEELRQIDELLCFMAVLEYREP